MASGDAGGDVDRLGGGVGGKGLPGGVAVTAGSGDALGGGRGVGVALSAGLEAEGEAEIDGAADALGAAAGDVFDGAADATVGATLAAWAPGAGSASGRIAVPMVIAAITDGSRATAMKRVERVWFMGVSP